MSRSYKKHPYVTDGSKGRRGRGKPMKFYAQKKVRSCEDLPTRERGAYKKVFETYDICDYKWSQTRSEAIHRWEQEELDYPLDRYYKVYSRKDDGTWGTEWHHVHKEVGPLHEQYGTLERFLSIGWKKIYLRK